MLQLEVYGQCEAIIYEAEIGPFAPDTEIDLGVITLDDTVISSTLTGSLVNCDGGPVTNGIVVIKFDGYTMVEYIDAPSFSIELSLCSQTESISVQAYDIDAALQSNELTLPANEEINVGTLPVCEDLENYIRINVDGQQALFYFAELRIVDSADVTTSIFYAYNYGNNSNVRKFKHQWIKCRKLWRNGRNKLR